jgi:hypothetical protein
MGQHLRYPANKNTGGYYFVFDSGYFDEMKVKFEKVGGKYWPRDNKQFKWTP